MPDEDNIIKRFHVQRASARNPIWKNLTPDTGVHLHKAMELHKDFEQKHRGDKLESKFRIHPISPTEWDEITDKIDKKRGRKPVNDND